MPDLSKLSDAELLKLEAELDAETTALNNKQMAIKIFMNSLYGAIANKWFRYYDVRMAEAITTSGQLSIRWAEKAANKYMNEILGTSDVDYVIAIDTDSLYLNFGPMVTQMGLDKKDKKTVVDIIDKIAELKFVPLFEQSYDDLANYMNAYQNRMVMGREVIADAGIWTAKKRYILNVLNSEGVQYAEPKLKIMGIEAVKSSTPAPCRTALKELFKVLISGTEKDTQKAIQMFREYFNGLGPESVAFPRGVSELNKWKDRDTLYKKGTPINSRGAILYNMLITELKLKKKYELIKEGEKIKFVYLNPKNPLKEDVIAFPNFMPKEFGLESYVDYSKQFEKAFLAVVRPILDAIGWKEEETVDLTSFFE